MSNDKFYIIGITRNVTGLGAILFTTLCHIKYALDNGYIPIVDLKHYKNQYFKDGRSFRDNTWEYFFEQPTKYNLDNIPDDAEIVISDNTNRPKGITNIISQELINEPIALNIQQLKGEYKKNIRFKPDIQNYLDAEYKRIIGNEKDVLGILCRGTDFTHKKPKGEPIQPDSKVVIQKAKELLKIYNFKKIYVATEDAEIFQRFKNEFGDMIIDNNQYRYSNNYTKDKFLSEVKVNRRNHNYLLGKEYLASLYILSKCKYFIAGQTSGSKVVGLLSEGFSYGYIWSLGTYGLFDEDNFYKKIFSIENKYYGVIKYKVIRILGVRIKIKVKQNKRNTI